MNHGHFCERKGHATVGGKVFTLTVSDFLERQLRRKTDKMVAKRDKEAARRAKYSKRPYGTPFNLPLSLFGWLR